MQTPAYPTVINGGLIDFQDSQAALYANILAQQQAQASAVYNQPLQTVYPQYPAAPGMPPLQASYQAFPPPPGPAPLQNHVYQQPGQSHVYQQQPGQASVVLGQPSYVQVNGERYEMKPETKEKPDPRPEPTRSQAEVERSIERRVSQRVNEFMAKRESAGLGSRASARPAPTRRADEADEYTRELKRLNADMSRALTRASARAR